MGIEPTKSRSHDPSPVLKTGPGSAKPPKNTGKTPHQRSLAPSLIHDVRQTDPDLAAVVHAWADLPDAIKAAIMAMVKAARS